MKCLKAWHERVDFPGDIAVICMKPDHEKRIAHQLQSLGVPHLPQRPVCDGRISHSPAGGSALPLLTDHFALGTFPTILSVQSSKGLEFRPVIVLFPEN